MAVIICEFVVSCDLRNIVCVGSQIIYCRIRTRSVFISDSIKYYSSVFGAGLSAKLVSFRVCENEGVISCFKSASFKDLHGSEYDLTFSLICVIYCGLIVTSGIDMSGALFVRSGDQFAVFSDDSGLCPAVRIVDLLDRVSCACRQVRYNDGLAFLAVYYYLSGGRIQICALVGYPLCIECYSLSVFSKVVYSLGIGIICTRSVRLSVPALEDGILLSKSVFGKSS